MARPISGHIDLAPAPRFGNSPLTAPKAHAPSSRLLALRHHGLPRRRAFRRLLGPVLDSAALAGAPRFCGQLGECRALQRGQPGAAALPLSAPPATPARSRAARRHRNPVGPGFRPLDQFADLWRRRPGDAAVLSDACLVDDPGRTFPAQFHRTPAPVVDPARPRRRLHGAEIRGHLSGAAGCARMVRAGLRRLLRDGHRLCPQIPRCRRAGEDLRQSALLHPFRFAVPAHPAGSRADGRGPAERPA